MDVHDQETPHAMSHKTRIALLIADRIQRRGVETILAEEAVPYQVTAFDRFDTFFEQASLFDVLLNDVSTRSFEEIESELAQLQRCCPELRILIVSDQLSGAHILRVIQLGARGFIHRNELSDTLLDNITLMARNVVALSAQIAHLLIENEPSQVTTMLKQTDMQVLHMMAQGAPIKQIAHTLDISERSIYRIRDKLRRLLGVNSSELIVSAAREQGLLQPGDDISRPLHPD